MLWIIQKIPPPSPPDFKTLVTSNFHTFSSIFLPASALFSNESYKRTFIADAEASSVWIYGSVRKIRSPSEDRLAWQLLETIVGDTPCPEGIFAKPHRANKINISIQVAPPPLSLCMKYRAKNFWTEIIRNNNMSANERDSGTNKLIVI